ncbi:MAG: GNAT family N-acetyltransferase [Kofleriaceae bacterium]
MDAQLAISVRLATEHDVDALAGLVNRAYEVEEFFIEGDRTTAREIAELSRAGDFLVLECHRGLAAAVYVEHRGHAGYFGMLAVEPAFQGMGLGTRLVRLAEAMGEAMGAKAMTLRIVNLREELGRWYRSLGYREVSTSPFDHRAVKKPCHFVEMCKRLVGEVGEVGEVDGTSDADATVDAVVAS